MLVELRTMGDLCITVGEREIRPSSPLIFAALIYLGIERGRRIPRASLQRLFFASVDEPNASHSLRQLLYKLKHLGVALETSAHDVILPKGLVIDQRTALLAPEALPTTATCDLTFLPGYVPRLGSDFDEWLEMVRQTHRELVFRRVGGRLRILRAQGLWEAVALSSHRLLALDNLHEETTLAFAEASMMLGRKAEALRILEQFELEVGSGYASAAAALKRRIATSTTVTIPPLPLAGREAEIRILREAIVSARSGSPSFTFLIGEAGVGKTRLLDECHALTVVENVRRLSLKFVQPQLERPLSLFVELIPQLLQCRGALGASPDCLTTLSAFTASAQASPQYRDTMDADTKRTLLRSAVLDLVSAVIAEAPLLLILDDCQYADRESIVELLAIVTACSRVPLAVVCASRHEVFDAQAVAFPRSHLVRVGPLPDEAMRQIVAKELPEVVGDARTRLVDIACGNPLFLLLTCAHYAATGDLGGLSEDLTAVIDRRLRSLPQPARQLLELCSVLGRRATSTAVGELSNLSGSDLVACVRSLESAGLLRWRDNHISVAHDLIGEVVAQRTPEVTRRLLHGQVAHWLETQTAISDGLGLVWDTAAHWTMSGEPARAVTHILACARQAVEMGRATQALSLLERAFELAATKEARSAILSEMMVAAKAVGNWPLCHEYSERRRHLVAGTAHDAYELVDLEARWFGRFEATETLASLQRCVNSGASESHKLESAVLALKIAHETGHSTAIADIMAAVERLLPAHETSYAARIAPVIYHGTFGEQALAVSHAQRLMLDIDFIEGTATRLRAAHNCAGILAFVGAFEESTRIAEQFFHRSESLGLVNWSIQFAALACTNYCMVEDFAKASAWHALSRPAVALGDAFGGIPQVVLANGIELAVASGDVIEALQLIDLARQQCGDALRFKAYLRGNEVRARILDERYMPSPAEVEELELFYARTKTLSCADALVCALLQCYARSKDALSTSSLLKDYLAVRRERSPLPPSILAMMPNDEFAA